MDSRRLNLALEFLGALDLDAGSGMADVREAYRLQLKSWRADHPAFDARVKQAAERRVAEIQQAYDWLQAHSEAVLSIADAAGAGSRSSQSSHGRKSVSVQTKAGLAGLPGDRKTVSIVYLTVVVVLLIAVLVILAIEPNALFGPFRNVAPANPAGFSGTIALHIDQLTLV